MVALAPAEDTEAADWIVAALRTFAESVTSLVPEGYPAYVRVFHPAYREQEPLRWSDIASANGRHAHAGMQLCGLTGSYRFEREGQPGVYDRPPIEGSLPAEIRPSLAAVLSQHTTTPDRCWFAIWNGYGTNARREDVQRAPTFKVPGREYHLLRGPVESIYDEMLAPPWRQSANIWWADDHAWCVATEIDLKTTYIACSEACSDALIATDLEAMLIDPTTGISWKSDLLNPEPSPPGSEP